MFYNRKFPVKIHCLIIIDWSRNMGNIYVFKIGLKLKTDSLKGGGSNQMIS